MRTALFAAALVGMFAACAYAQTPYWVDDMHAVHSHFTGTPGTVVRMGDSITVSLAFFKPLQWTTNTGDATTAMNWIRSYINTNPTPNNNCWDWANDSQPPANTGHDWEYKGAKGGMDSSWPLATDQHPSPAQTNVQTWLNNLHPEMAVIMFGTNDISHGLSVAAYKNNMRTIVQACKTNGTIPLLTTPPPRRSYDLTPFVTAVRELGVELQVPVIDYYDAILTRRPGTTWDNTLIGSDGVHPSAGANDFGGTNLSNYGYTLRNYVTVKGLYDVYQRGVVLPAPHAGDANRDNHVNVDDLGILATNYDGAGKWWELGDFTGDGTVNVDDLGVLSSNYDWASGGQSVPEPATLALLAAALALPRRSRR